MIGRVFPAFLEGPRAGHAGEALRIDEHSGCFFHPERRAVVPCAECGRFLCALCDLEIGGRHLCPTCLEAGRKRVSLDVFRTQHVRWDNIALMLATLPVVTLVGWYFSIFTAPAAIFISFWKWKTPSQAIVPYSRGRFVVAIIVALITLTIWGTILYFAFARRLR